MPYDIGPRIGIDGEDEFRRQLSNITTQVKTLGTEMTELASEFSTEGASMEQLRKRGELLQQSYDAQAKKVEEISKALAVSRERYDENDDKVLKWRQALANAQTQLNGMQKEIDRNNDAIDNFGKEVGETADELEDASKKAFSFGDALKANITGQAIIEGVKKLGSALKDITLGTAQWADELATMSTVTGISTEALQEYEYMSELVDVSVDTITGSMTKLIRNMSTAKEGTGAAAEAFAALGIEVTGADGQLRDSQTVFDEVIAALGSVENETQRDAYAMNIFGKSAQDLNPLLAQGAAGLDALRQEAHDMGYVMSGEAIDALLETSDASERLQKTIDAAKNELGAKLAPVITDVIERITYLIQNFDELKPVIMAGATAVGVYAAALGISKLIESVRKATESQTLAQAALNAVMNANPLAIVAAAIAGLVAAFVTAYKTSDEFRARVDAAWNGIKTTITGVVESIKTFFAVTIPNAAQAALDKLKAIPDEMRNVGRNLMQGIWNGISDKVAWLKSQVQGVVNKIKSWFTGSSGFDTHSPSKWSESVFRNVMEGGAVGIRKGESVLDRSIGTAIGNAQAALSSPLRVSAAGYGSAASVGSGSPAGASAGIQDATIIVQSVLDGKIIGETAVRYSDRVRRATK